jgi:hypothetical protein
VSVSDLMDPDAMWHQLKAIRAERDALKAEVERLRDCMDIRDEHITRLADRADRADGLIGAMRRDLQDLRAENATRAAFTVSLEEALLRMEHRALKAEAQCAQLREALADTMVPDLTGGLHHHDCVGIHGYPCKAWCGETRALLDSTDAGKNP